MANQPKNDDEDDGSSIEDEKLTQVDLKIREIQIEAAEEAFKKDPGKEKERDLRNLYEESLEDRSMHFTELREGADKADLEKLFQHWNLREPRIVIEAKLAEETHRLRKETALMVRATLFVAACTLATAGPL